MPAFIYVGPHRGAVRAYNATFEPGQALEVEERFVAKARANPDFDEVGSAPVTDHVIQDAEADEWRDYDKDDLQVYAELTGVPFDKRWGLERLQQAVAAHLRGDDDDDSAAGNEGPAEA